MREAKRLTFLPNRLSSLVEERESTPVHDDDDDEPSVRVREDVDVPIYPAAIVVVIAAAAPVLNPECCPIKLK